MSSKCVLGFMVQGETHFHLTLCYTLRFEYALIRFIM